MQDDWHLYEVVISNSLVWLKLQASRSSSGVLGKFFESRFTGSQRLVEGHLPVTPFRLSERSRHIANWVSIVDQLPAGWDDDEFQIVGTPYPWCESLSGGCDCHGAKVKRAIAVCSDFGLHEEKDKLESKSENAWYVNYFKEMEERIAKRDEQVRGCRLPISLVPTQPLIEFAVLVQAEAPFAGLHNRGQPGVALIQQQGAAIAGHAAAVKAGAHFAAALIGQIDCDTLCWHGVCCLIELN